MRNKGDTERRPFRSSHTIAFDQATRPSGADMRRPVAGIAQREVEPGRVAALHTRLLLQVVARGGVDVPSLLRDAGATVPEDPGLVSFVPAWAHEALYELAARRLGDPLLSLRMGEAASGDNFDLLAYALRTSDTLWDAASLGKRLHQRFSPHLWFDVERHPSEWRWVVAAQGSLAEGWPRREVEYLLRASLTTLDEIAGRPTPVIEVRFGHPPGGPVEAYERSFRAPARFSRYRTEILFPLEIAEWPSTGRDPVLARLLERQLVELLGSIPSDGQTSSQARAVIEEKLGSGIGERAVAAALGMPVRTLQHRLHLEGTTYSAILDDVRRLRGLSLVTNTRAPAAEISCALGYRDVRSFHRAFRRWTGCSPLAYRKKAGPRP